jgi:Na+/H+ antiporter NhaA
MTEPQPASPASITNNTDNDSTTTTSTAWPSSRQTPLRQFLATETGSAAILAAATAAALAWSNLHPATYASFWATELSVRVGGHGIEMDLREFVNTGLMSLFFLVVGLEARREFDMGELRVRSRVTLPFLAGIGGLIVPVVIFLAFNAGRPTAHGWGAAMSTDTAFAFGALALAGGKRVPDRVHTYLLTFAVVDDLVSLLVIAVAYSSHVTWLPLGIGAALLAASGLLAARGVRSSPAYLLIGLATWVAFVKSGVDPIAAAMVLGLLTPAYPAAREDLGAAALAFRTFREQPTARLAREAREVVGTAISRNERMQERYHPWASYVIVPLFALANADIPLSRGFLAHAYAAPVTLGVMLGYLIGKPVGTAGAAWLVSKVSRGRVTPTVGWGAVAGAGAAAGIGFAVSLVIASLAFTGTDLADAKLGMLTAAIGSTALSWLIFTGVNRLSPNRRLRALLGTSKTITDLAVPVDPDRDHIRGPKKNALVTLVEYGDFECPYCGLAEPAVRSLLADHGELRFVFRHLPLTDVHPRAQLAAEAAEAAQGKFWEMHDTLMTHQTALTAADLIGYARDLALDAERFARDLRRHAGAARVAEDVDSADLATVAGTPTFFVNGIRYYGALDLGGLAEAVRTAKGRAAVRLDKTECTPDERAVA